MRARSEDMPIPLGHVERPRASSPLVGLCAPDHATYRPGERVNLDTPTITRRAAQARAMRWEDEPDEVRAEVRAAAIEQLTLKLQTARRVLADNPGLENVEAIDKLERALAAAERLS